MSTRRSEGRDSCPARVMYVSEAPAETFPADSVTEREAKKDRLPLTIDSKAHQTESNRESPPSASVRTRPNPRFPVCAFSSAIANANTPNLDAGAPVTGGPSMHWVQNTTQISKTPGVAWGWYVLPFQGTSLSP